MIVLVTVPFLGHYNAMRSIANQYLQQNIRVNLIVLTWLNVPAPDESKNRLLNENRIVIETSYALEETDPTKFNWMRAKHLTYALFIRLSQAYVLGRQIVDCVLYDFFCPEAYFVARSLRLPSVCCVPAVPMQMQMPLHIDHSLLRELEAENHCDQISLACVSDFAFINDINEPKWLFTHPSLALDTAFLGSKTKHVNPSEPSENVSKRIENAVVVRKIYVCFGTVVTGNLWYNASADWRNKLVQLYKSICDFCHRSKTECLIAIPGALEAYYHIVECLREQYEHSRFGREKYSFITWAQSVDQRSILQSGEYDVFVTHGGGNSVTEALDSGIPLVCVPFFGDQFASAYCIEGQRLGAAFMSAQVERAQVVSTQSCLENLTLFDEKIAFITTQLPNICTGRWLQLYHAQKSLIAQKRDSALDAVGEFRERSRIRWIDGDWLFGTSADRASFCQHYALNPTAMIDVPAPGFDFCFGKPFDAFSISQRYPTLLDHLNDCIYVDSRDAVDQESFKSLEMGAMLEEYSKCCTPYQGRVADMQTSIISSICISAIDFYLFRQTLLPRGAIHFVIGSNFFWNPKSTAHAELDFILDRCYRTSLLQYVGAAARVYFYILIDNSYLKRVHVLDALEFNWLPLTINRKLAPARFQCNEIDWKLQSLLQKAAPSLGGALMEKRVKTRESLLHNFQERYIFVSSDIIGFRIVHPFTSTLFELAALIEASFRTLSRVVSERGRVLHLVLYEPDFGGCVFEVQLWPSVLHSCFIAEHDKVYKSREPLSDGQLHRSKRIRTQQHAVQDLIDQNGSIILK